MTQRERIFSPKISWIRNTARKEGKVNTMKHGQGENIDKGEKIDTEGKNIFHSTLPAKVEQLIAWPRREKIKKNIIYFPQLEYADTVTKKRLCPAGKI